MSDLPVLRRLRRLWLAFAVVVTGILAALPFLDPEPSDIPAVLPATLAAAGGVGAFIAIVAVDLTFAASPPADDERALHEFEARSTLGFAIAQAPAVLGFALAFAFGMVLPAAIGGGCAAVCLFRARPSAARLGKLEAAWSSVGADVSVLRAAEPTSSVTDPHDLSPPDGDEVADPRTDDTDGTDPR